jgi:serine/threonine-protein kinase
MGLSELRGDCARLESDARRMIAVEPRGAAGYAYLVEAQVANGAPREAIDETLRAHDARLPEPQRAEAALEMDTRLAALDGDFARAKDRAAAWTASLSADKDEEAHAHAALAKVMIEDEMGDVAAAGDTAATFMARRSAWVRSTRNEDYALAGDVSPLMIAAERRAGRVSIEDAEAQRAQWVSAWQAKLAPVYRYTLWVRGFAEPADSPSDAEAALVALPGDEATRAFGPIAFAAASLGRVELLAGRAADALPALEEGARVCAALTHPIDAVRAIERLGAGLETKGDAAGACAAYARVLARWGQARPRSVTADRARARSRALACP